LRWIEILKRINIARNKSMQEIVIEKEWLGRKLTFKTGKLAKQADAAVTVQYGDTVVLATVVESKYERPGITFFPLMVDFEERFYAAGIIKGSRWVKREGRPSDDSVLTGRMIDRSVRPLFKGESRKEIQVILTVLSADKENDHDIVGLIAASAALSISGVDWNGPIGSVRVGRIENNYVFNPTYEQRLLSDLDLIVAGTDQRTIMIEANAQEMPEDIILEAISTGQKELQGAISAIIDLKKAAPIKTKPKKEASSGETEALPIMESALGWLEKNIEPILFDKTYYSKGERKAAVSAIKDGLEKFLRENNFLPEEISSAVEKLVEPMVESAVTKAILEKGARVDGRKLDEIRALSAEPSLLPRNHGSGLFSRGETQVLSIITLGPPGVEQSLEGIEGFSTKRFMHHYNFPPYSVGEAKRLMSAGRREIGHGALAERALEPVIPSKEDFPYTIRVVSETLGSNGSSSMASTCGSSLALMDAGVPIKNAVAGIAMGLASNDDMSRWEVLTDLQDLEDGKGGMDFKIAGTKNGITSIQLDTKTIGLDEKIIKKTLEQGRTARLEILDVMNSAIDSPRAELSPYAPRVLVLHINPDKIRDVIGSGGKIINSIIEATGVSIDIEQDGTVFVAGTDAEKCNEAIEWIKNLTREVAAGETFKGSVVRILDFGAFVEILPGRDGMVHVSEMAPFRINKPSDMLNVGDEVTVNVKEIDDMGRVNLTMKGLEENTSYWDKYKLEHPGGAEEGSFGQRGERPRFGSRDNRPPRRDGNR
jgi:polyribonucleotide nucleotidyltransferase